MTPADRRRWLYALRVLTEGPGPITQAYLDGLDTVALRTLGRRVIAAALTGDQPCG